MSHEKELNFAKELAYEVGAIMRRYFNANDIGTEIKDDNTPVTIADTTINELVIEKVKSEYPDCGVIGEEDSYETKRDKVWVVDPIDGTMPFSLGIPVSTFCLGLVVAGKAMVGVVYDPFQDKLFSAKRGSGAYLNNLKLNVSEISDWKKCYMGLSNQQRTDSVKKSGARVFDLYSYAYSAALVANGSFVAAAMDYGSPWDAAAASIIVEEAGGLVTDLNGEVRKFNEWGEGIVMTNGIVHSKLLEMINHEDSRH